MSGPAYVPPQLRDKKQEAQYNKQNHQEQQNQNAYVPPQKREQQQSASKSQGINHFAGLERNNQRSQEQSAGLYLESNYQSAYSVLYAYDDESKQYYTLLALKTNKIAKNNINIISNPGQYVFSGGKKKQDSSENCIQTALRELGEELGFIREHNRQDLQQYSKQVIQQVQDMDNNKEQNKQLQFNNDFSALIKNVSVYNYAKQAGFVCLQTSMNDLLKFKKQIEENSSKSNENENENECELVSAVVVPLDIASQVLQCEDVMDPSELISYMHDYYKSKIEQYMDKALAERNRNFQVKITKQDYSYPSFLKTIYVTEEYKQFEKNLKKSGRTDWFYQGLLLLAKELQQKLQKDDLLVVNCQDPKMGKLNKLIEQNAQNTLNNNQFKPQGE